LRTRKLIANLVRTAKSGKPIDVLIKPDYELLTGPDQRFVRRLFEELEIQRRFRERWEKTGDLEAAKKAAWKFARGLH